MGKFSNEVNKLNEQFKKYHKVILNKDSSFLNWRYLSRQL